MDLQALTIKAQFDNTTAIGSILKIQDGIRAQNDLTDHKNISCYQHHFNRHATTLICFETWCDEFFM